MATYVPGAHEDLRLLTSSPTLPSVTFMVQPLFSLPGSKIPTRSPSTVVGCIFQVEVCNFMYAEDVTSLQYHKSDRKYYCPAAVLPAEALTACPAYRAVMLWPRQKKILAFG